MNEYLQACLAEFIGTTILLLMGNGVVANVLLSQTKGNNSGWIVITAGWGLAVYTAVLCSQDISGAHLNPAVTIGLVAAGKFAWTQTPGYLAAQFAGGFFGSVIVYSCYLSHFASTKDADAKLGTFCTAPAIRHLPLNFFCEAVATFVLVYAVLMTTDPTVAMPAAAAAANQTETLMQVGLGSIGAIRVGLVVFAIGLCLGGTTGYAINPARDLSPRIAHFLLPITDKRDSDWSYAPIPVLGPIAGGVLAAVVFLFTGPS